MTTTANSLITVIARHLEEDTAFSTGLWTGTEILQYLASSDVEFAVAAGLIKVVGSVAAVVNQTVYSEPTECVDMERVAWNGRKMYPQTRFSLDRQSATWRADSGTPQRFYRDQLPPKQFGVWKKPTVSGTGYTTSGTYGGLRRASGSLTYSTSGTYGLLRSAHGASRNYYYAGSTGGLRRAVSGASNFLVFYDQIPTAITYGTDYLTTPDAFVRYVMYRALEKAWSKEGDGQDMNRSAFCGVRFKRGVDLARRIVYGDEGEVRG